MKALRPIYTVNDIGCGDGVGCTLVIGKTLSYYGYEKERMWADWMPGRFQVADLDDPAWEPEQPAHLTCCFDLLDRVPNPDALAATLARFTTRFLFISLRTSGRVEGEHTFNPRKVSALMFPTMVQQSKIEFPSEGRHLFRYRLRLASDTPPAPPRQAPTLGAG